MKIGHYHYADITWFLYKRTWNKIMLYFYIKLCRSWTSSDRPKYYLKWLWYNKSKIKTKYYFT